MNEPKEKSFAEYDRLNQLAFEDWLKSMPYSNQNRDLVKLLTEAAIKNIVARQWATLKIARISIDGN